MSLRVIGAGLGRTGTMSLKQALETLLGGRCYHMIEVIERRDHVPRWDAALRGETPRWQQIFDGFVATVDWPSVTFWEELHNHYPDAFILMSYRRPEDWWESAHQTIFEVARRIEGPWRAMADRMFERFSKNLEDRAMCLDAFERHYRKVRDVVPRDRLIEWQPGDGWGPLCKALDVAVPAIEFPRVNTREEYLERLAAMPARVQV